MQIDKTDQNDAEGLARIVRNGWYRLGGPAVLAGTGVRARLAGPCTAIKNIVAFAVGPEADGWRSRNVQAQKHMSQLESLKEGWGSPWFGLSKLESQGEPHAGFWPALSYYPKRPGGVASSRSEDPKYRSGEKTRRRRALAQSHERRSHGGTGRQGDRRRKSHALPLE